MLGPKIDARLNLLERKLVDLTHRLEQIDNTKQPAIAFIYSVERRISELNERLERLEVPPHDTSAAPVAENAGVDATLTPKPRRGRPPKAKNG